MVEQFVAREVGRGCRERETTWQDPGETRLRCEFTINSDFTWTVHIRPTSHWDIAELHDRECGLAD